MMHSWGSALPSSSAACLLQHLHVLNLAVLIKLLNSCHITLGRQQDSFASMFICNSLAIYTLHIHTGQQGNAAHFSPRRGGYSAYNNRTITAKQNKHYQKVETHTHTHIWFSVFEGLIPQLLSLTLTIKKEKGKLERKQIKYMNHFCNICFCCNFLMFFCLYKMSVWSRK